MSFNLPSHLMVGGKKIQVKVKKLEGAHACYEPGTYSIFVDPGTRASDVEMYLFHELVHAALHISGVEHVIQPEVEESIAWSLQHMLFPLYQRKKSK